MELRGYLFRLVWAATAMTVIVNDTNYKDARERTERRWLQRIGRERGALFVQFLGTCEPLPPNRREKLPRKVF